MNDDLKFEIAKNEIVESLNNIIDKYNLPLTIIEVILSNILNEVSNIKKQKLQKDMEEYQKKESEE